MALVRTFETVVFVGKTTPLQHGFCVARQQSSLLLRLVFCSYHSITYFSLLLQKQLVFFQPCKALNYRTLSLNCRPQAGSTSLSKSACFPSLLATLIEVYFSLKTLSGKKEPTTHASILNFPYISFLAIALVGIWFACQLLQMTV